MEERETASEGQIATALLLSPLPSIRSSYQSCSPYCLPLSTLARLHLFSFRVSPPAFITPFHSSSTSFWVLLCHLHTGRSLFQFYFLGLHIAHTHTHMHTQAHVYMQYGHAVMHTQLTHLSCLLSVRKVITSQTHPHKHHFNLGPTPRNAQRHKNIYGLHTTRADQLNLICFLHQMGLRNGSSCLIMYHLPVLNWIDASLS